jgi:hypothetical protein
LGSSNNVNEQGFSSQDLLGLGKMGSVPPPPGALAAGASQMNGDNQGINKNHSLGINYSDSWGKKWTASGSYFFNQTNNTTGSKSEKTYLLTDSSAQHLQTLTKNYTHNYNHRFNLRLDCKIDSSNSITIIPSFNTQHNSSEGQTQTRFINDSLSTPIFSIYSSDNKGYELSNSVFYRHKFAKKGRSLFIDFSQNAADKTATYYSASTVTKLASSNRSISRGLTSRISYSEPLGTKTLLKLSYAPSVKFEKVDKETFNYDSGNGTYSIKDSSASNNYEMTTYGHRMGLGFLFKRKKTNFNIGTDYQLQKLQGNESFPEKTDVEKTYHSPLAHADFFYKANKRTFLHAGYDTDTKNPSVTQLQNTINNTNQLYLSEGNPNLEQQYTHNLRCMYHHVDYTLTRTFFLAIRASLSNNYIASSDYTAKADTSIRGISLMRGAQLSKPVNMSGYYTIDGTLNYSFPIYLIKSNLNLQSGYDYSCLPGIINGEENKTLTQSINAGIKLVSNISKSVDFNLSYRGTYHLVNYTLQKETDENYYNGNASANLTLTSPNTHWVLSSDASLNYNQGLGEYYDRPVVLWNMGLAYKFLKNNAAEFRLTAYDLLNDNKSISRTVNSSYIETTENEVLKRYILISFCYNIHNFSNS